MQNNIDKEYFVDFGPVLLTLLGPNLYTNIYYVLSELIANAYDADAENVYISYNSNVIRVEDDGNGMAYEEFNSKFLPIGVPTRTSNADAYSPGGRKRMGRKGIGKLAALSISSNVRIQSRKDNDQSGCILSLDMAIEEEDGRYKIPAIVDADIKFFHLSEGANGSSIIMENPSYGIYKSVESAKTNILLMFPFASDDFKIHIINETTSERTIITDATSEQIKLCDSLITFSPDVSAVADNNYKSTLFSNLTELHSSFDTSRYYDAIKEKLPKEEWPEKVQLNLKKDSIIKELNLINNSNQKQKYSLEIYGWIATYATKKGKKKETDFPINHISLIANGKLGKYDILPEITTDRMNEAYIIGQFFIDLLDETELPDIALSNRQGYKQDERYKNTLELIRKHALLPVLTLKDLASKEKNFVRDRDRRLKSLQSKQAFNEQIESLIHDKDINAAITKKPQIRKHLEEAFELKDLLRKTERKIMISHRHDDKEIADEVEAALHFCGFSPSEIIYTSSDSYESTVKAYGDIYKFLEDFFVKTVERSDLCVIYLVNEHFICKWNPSLEAGAGWVCRSTSFPLYTDDFRNVLSPFPQTPNTPHISFDMPDIKIRVLADMFRQVCEATGKSERTEEDIYTFLKNTKLSE